MVLMVSSIVANRSERWSLSAGDRPNSTFDNIDLQDHEGLSKKEVLFQEGRS
jgi:hypothetical protein